MSKARGPYRVDPLGYKKSQQALDKKAENARELGLDYEPAQQAFVSPGGGYVPAIPAQQEPVALKWQQAPVKTQWGDEMVVASVAIDKDHTVCLYCERDQAPKVEAMFAQRSWEGLTHKELIEIMTGTMTTSRQAMAAVEAKLKEKNTCAQKSN